MKIAKFTWLYNGNYGSVLQAYALQKYLINNGYDVEDINYKASLKTKLANWFFSRNSASLFIGKYKDFKGNNNDKYSDKLRNKNIKFNDFKNKYMRLSKLCTNPKQLKEISNNYDVFICGSDQIWSPALFNPVYYFSFVPNNIKKISYAPSFGVVTTTKWKRKKIAELLGRFNSISIRESQGKKMISEIIGRDVPVVVDPTLLLTREEWDACIEQKKVENGKYIFCYLLSSNDTYVKAIKEFAKTNELDVIIIPNSKGPFDTGFKEMIDVGPEEWVNLIKNAEYVFTDSFHGTIFSMLYHKDFILFERFSNKSKTSENSRIYTLMNMVDLEERIINTNNLDRIYRLNEINYEKIDGIISEKAQESGKWLIDSLEESRQ